MAGAVALAGAVAGAVAVAIILVILTFSGGGLTTGGVGLTLLFVTPPVLNAFLDWPSWWASRWLGRRLLAQLGGEAARWRRFAVLGIHGLIDFAAALLFLYLLAVALPFAIELFNLWALARGEAKPLELGAFLEAARQQPWPNALWVLLMLASTVFPTLLHAMALVASPVMIWLGSDAGRERLAAELTSSDPPPLSAVREASWHLVWTWLTAFVAPLLMLALFLAAIGMAWEPVGEVLLGAAHRGVGMAADVAKWIGWIAS